MLEMSTPMDKLFRFVITFNKYDLRYVVDSPTAIFSAARYAKKREGDLEDAAPLLTAASERSLVLEAKRSDEHILQLKEPLERNGEVSFLTSQDSQHGLHLENCKFDVKYGKPQQKIDHLARDNFGPICSALHT